MNKYLPTVAVTLIVALLLTTGGQYMYIQKVQIQSAAWAQQVSADSAKRVAFIDSLASASLEVAVRDSVIATLRVNALAQDKIIKHATRRSSEKLAAARDTLAADSSRFHAYEQAIEALDQRFVAAVKVIASRDAELQEAEEIRLRLESVVNRSLARIGQLEALLAAAPAVQAAPKGPGPLKVVAGFLAGIGVGVVTGLVLR